LKKIEELNSNGRIYLELDKKTKFINPNVPENICKTFENDTEFQSLFDEGLLATIGKHIEENKPRMVNID
jgi:hypothetical protein